MQTAKLHQQVNRTKENIRSRRVCFKIHRNHAEFENISNWKDSRRDKNNEKLQTLQDKKIVIETYLRELELHVVEPPRIGTYNTICGNCHIRGHRSQGNRNNAVLLPRVHHICKKKKKKLKEHFDEIKERKRELKDINREIDNTVLEKKNLDAFQSKSQYF